MADFCDDITPVVLTANEAPNIARCLERLAWAKRVIVVDSLSTDGTAAIVALFPNAELHPRAFDNHTAQWNFGIDLVSTGWVLSLDADYVLPETFAVETEALTQREAVDAFFAKFRYVVAGRRLRGTLYPPRAVLFRKDRCRYEADGHTQRLRVDGPAAFLKSVIDHDDRKPLSRWLASQDKYAVLEADKLLAPDRGPLGLQDRLRLWMFPAPVLTLFYCLFARGLVLDGWRGWFYTWQRVLAEVILALRLIERRIEGKAGKQE